jgi:hypothetical protein
MDVMRLAGCLCYCWPFFARRSAPTATAQRSLGLFFPFLFFFRDRTHALLSATARCVIEFAAWLLCCQIRTPLRRNSILIDVLSYRLTCDLRCRSDTPERLCNIGKNGARVRTGIKFEICRLY